jgi:hypothetical protein
VRGVQPSGASPRGWSSASPEPGGAGVTLLIRPASPSSTSRTLERARSTWGQLFQGVTGAGVRLPMEHAPVTCMSRPGARGPRSQGPASHPTFRASALPPQIRSARLSVWREVVGVSMRHGGAGGDKLRSHPTPEPPIPYPSGLTGRSTLIAACCSAWGYGTAGTAHPVLNSGREWALRSSRRDADERGVCPHPKHRLPSGLTGGPI